ncbi:MAG: 50S ribosomal protein L6 [Candidatus Nomurabacteria bacterium GW2011_GWB1_37_5]|uniref:Large ribosomal subunit protein uL6 n=1 Tax=Candidatus Nomurabacteria bacterium GW2011_GWB1_37_5 TaxID=1618742 RepID=A0A0G0GWA5_9BACT|nr:MAG: 50S ribosomal protein L6 [Candidatus Nomurabacteria bacterium GW2011_GWB1_37_5]
MSKIGKQIINIPKGTEVKIDGGNLSVKGPKGTLERSFRDEVEIKIENNEVKVNPRGSSKFARSLWGTSASHIKNMIKGVNEGYEKKLLVEGVGYKWEATPKQVTLALGFSHPVKIDVPPELKVVTEKSTMTISGIDKEMVGEFSAKIRALKKPEPYKGKGIRYQDEHVRRKQGKKTA